MQASSYTPHSSGFPQENFHADPSAPLDPMLLPSLQRAEFATEKGSYEQALEIWTTVTRLQPESAYAHLNRASLLVELSCWTEAITAFQHAVCFQPQLKEAHYGLGMSYGHLGYFSQAIEALQQAASIQKDAAERTFQQERQRLYDLACAQSQAYVTQMASYTFSVESPALPLDSAVEMPLSEVSENDSQRRSRKQAKMEEAQSATIQGSAPRENWAERAIHKLTAPFRRYGQQEQSPSTPLPHTAQLSEETPSELADEPTASHPEVDGTPLSEAGVSALMPETSGNAAKGRSLSETLTYLRRARRQRIETPEIVFLCNKTADYLTERGQYANAETLYRQSLSIQRKMLPEGHPDIGLGFNNLALLYDSQKQFSKAEPLYRHALEIIVHALGPQDLNTQTVIQNYCSMLNEQGKREQASTLLASLGYHLPNA